MPRPRYPLSGYVRLYTDSPLRVLLGVGHTVLAVLLKVDILLRCGSCRRAALAIVLTDTVRECTLGFLHSWGLPKQEDLRAGVDVRVPNTVAHSFWRTLLLIIY